jgi:hypothetical protein
MVGGDPVPVLHHGCLPQPLLEQGGVSLGADDPIAQAVGGHRERRAQQALQQHPADDDRISRCRRHQ